MRCLYLFKFLFLLCSWSGVAAATGWPFDIRKRAAERQKEKWYFSDHLAGKAESKRQDLLYRFFLGSRTPKPRLELEAYALGELTRVHSYARDWQAPSSAAGNGYGYGGRLAANHFLSWATGLPTPNIVPSAVAELTELRVEGQEKVFLRQNLGAGFRLFGQNPQDTAVYVDYVRKRVQFPYSQPVGSVGDSGTGSEAVQTSRLTPGLFEGFVIELSAQFYLFPVFAVRGGGVLNQGFIEPHQLSETYLMQQFHIGGQLDFVVFQLAYKYSSSLFSPRVVESGLSQTNMISHALQLGFVF